jgi:hypothetical protein
MSKNNISNTIYPVALPPSTTITTELLSTNVDSISHTYKCKKIVYTIASDDTVQFCWGGLCYPTVNVSSLSTSIAPGDTVDFVAFGFHAIFKSKLSTMVRYVHYIFYDIANVNDSMGVTIQYNSLTGVEEMNRLAGTMEMAYPNPSNSIVSIDYSVNQSSSKGKIIFFDLLGKTVKEIALSDKTGTAKIYVDDLTAGIYFYSFLVDGKAISTRKLVVSSK